MRRWWSHPAFFACYRRYRPFISTFLRLLVIIIYVSFLIIIYCPSKSKWRRFDTLRHGKRFEMLDFHAIHLEIVIPTILDRSVAIAQQTFKYLRRVIWFFTKTALPRLSRAITL